jgi:hypothetical protein
MMPFPPGIKTKILAWLPHRLGGKDYPVKETDNIVPDLIAPAITFYFSSVGTPSQFDNQLIRTTVNASQEREEWWGQYHFATMNVVLRAHNKEEMEGMWYDFYSKCLATRRDAKIYYDGWRFLEVLDSKPLVPAHLKDGTDLFWAQVDLRFEYEVLYNPEEDFIKTVRTELEVGEAVDDHIVWTSTVRTVELPAKIVVYIAPLPA